MVNRSVVRTCCGIGLALLCLARPAGADGWKIQMQGLKAMGSAYAGRSVLVEDASTIWFNPAGMLRLEDKWTITVGAPVITYQLEFRDGGSRSVLGQPLQGEAVQDGGRTAVVPHVYIVRRIGSRWRAGFGFNAPFGLGTDYGETWVGRYHATETTLTVFNMNPSVAVRLNDRVSIGGGFDLQRSSGTLANMIDFGSIGAAVGLPLTPQQQDGKVEFTGSDWAAGFDAGIAIDVTPRTRVGATYRAKTEARLEGEAAFTVPSAAAPLTGGGLLFATSGARTTLPMPHELSVSGSHEFRSGWVWLADMNWTKWSAFEELRLTFDNPFQPPVTQAANWDDSVRFATGFRAPFGERWSIRGGLAYETTPVPDATRTPRLPERDHTWLTTSASYKRGDRLQWDLMLAHLITPDAPLMTTDPAAGVLIGDVHWRLNLLGVSATIRF